MRPIIILILMVTCIIVIASKKGNKKKQKKKRHKPQVTSGNNDDWISLLHLAQGSTDFYAWLDASTREDIHQVTKPEPIHPEPESALDHPEPEGEEIAVFLDKKIELPHENELSHRQNTTSQYTIRVNGDILDFINNVATKEAKKSFFKHLQYISEGDFSRGHANTVQGHHGMNARIRKVRIGQKHGGARLEFELYDNNIVNVTRFIPHHKHIARASGSVSKDDSQKYVELTEQAILSGSVGIMDAADDDQAAAATQTQRHYNFVPNGNPMYFERQSKKDNYRALLELKEEQEKIRDHNTGKFLFLNAPPGTGKTVLLLSLMIESDRMPEVVELELAPELEPEPEHILPAHLDPSQASKQIYFSRSLNLTRETKKELMPMEEGMAERMIFAQIDQSVTGAADEATFVTEEMFASRFNEFKSLAKVNSKESALNEPASVVWAHIQHIIKGSVLAAKNGRALNLKEYKESAKKNTTQSDEILESIFKVYEVYESYKRSKEFDTLGGKDKPIWLDIGDCVLSHLGTATDEFTRIYVDEVQDVTSAMILLFLRLVGNNPNRLTLAGDVVQQLVPGVMFRVEDVKDILYFVESENSSRVKLDAETKEPKTLKTNYRNSSGVVEMGNHVKNLLRTQFKLTNAVEDSGIVTGVPPVIWGYAHPRTLQDMRTALGDAPNATLIFRTEAERQVFLNDPLFSRNGSNSSLRGSSPGTNDNLQINTVSLHNAKGLEYENVILVNFFSSSVEQIKHSWRHLLNTTSESAEDKLRREGYYDAMEYELRILYTAISRTKTRLFIFETQPIWENELSKYVIDHWLKPLPAMGHVEPEPELEPEKTHDVTVSDRNIVTILSPEPSSDLTTILQLEQLTATQKRQTAMRNVLLVVQSGDDLDQSYKMYLLQQAQVLAMEGNSPGLQGRIKTVEYCVAGLNGTFESKADTISYMMTCIPVGLTMYASKALIEYGKNATLSADKKEILRKIALELGVNESALDNFQGKTSGHTSVHKSKATGQVDLDINAVDVDGNTALMRAAISGIKRDVYELLRQNANVDIQNKSMETALILAAKDNHRAVVDKLLQNGAKLDVKDHHGKTALDYATALETRGVRNAIERQKAKNTVLSVQLLDYVTTGQKGRLKTLLSTNAFDVNESYFNDVNYVTLLMVASQNGHTDTVVTLLEHGANVEAKDDNDLTSLMAASDNGHTATVIALLERGANIEAKDNNGVTSLMTACFRGQTETVKALLKRGANINANSNTGWTALMTASDKGNTAIVNALLERRVAIEAKNDAGWTSLMIASQNGKTETVNALLDRNANIEAEDNIGTTSLMAASGNGETDTVIALLKRGPDIEAKDHKGWTSLIWAASKGHTATVNALLERHANTEAKANDDWTPLMFASGNGYIEIVKALLLGGADVHIPDNNVLIPLTFASQKGHTEVVELLLANGADVNLAQMDGITPLWIASEVGHVGVVRLLLGKGANVNQPKQNGVTPLLIASQKGHTEVVELLIANGADINKSNKNGFTPLYVATRNGHQTVVAKLIDGLSNESKNNALFDAAEKGHAEVVARLLRAGADVNQTENSVTPLYVASQNGHERVVELLIEEDADVNQPTEMGATPLFIASNFGHIKVVKQLIDADDIDINKAEKDGYTPLFVASQKGYVGIVEELIAADAFVNQATKSGVTPLLVASENGHHKVVTQLITAGADVNQAEKIGGTPLLIASQKGYAGVVGLLIGAGAGADVNQPNKKGVTPLYIASQENKVEVIKKLIEAKACVNFADNFGSTPLLIASQKGRVDIVELLLEKGADLNKATNDGYTPLYAASQNDHVGVVELLIDAGAYVNQAAEGEYTPLYVASHKGNEGIVELLIEGDADVNQPTKNGSTPLFIASNFGHVGIVEELIAADAVVNQPKQNGVTPLLIASQKGHTEVVELLIANGADVNKANKNGFTPLYVATRNGHQTVVAKLIDVLSNEWKNNALFDAAEKGHAEVVAQLLRADADVNQPKNGVTPLLIASLKGNTEIAKALLECGADIEAKDHQGWTSLIWASENDYIETVKALLQDGADVNAKNNNGVTATDLARKNGHKDILALLNK